MSMLYKYVHSWKQGLFWCTNAYWLNGRDISDFLLGLWSFEIPWDELDWLKENKIVILELGY